LMFGKLNLNLISRCLQLFDYRHSLGFN
jgi:hypothetical protein